MRISRKLTAASVAAVAALAIAACSPPNENDSEIGKVPTAETQNPDSLNNGQPGFETEQPSSEAPAPAESSAEATIPAAPGEEGAVEDSTLEMGQQGIVTEQY